MAIVDQAIKTRTCHRCRGKIKTNEFHMSFTSNMYPGTHRENLCVKCLLEMFKEIVKHNNCEHVLKGWDE